MLTLEECLYWLAQYFHRHDQNFIVSRAARGQSLALIEEARWRRWYFLDCLKHGHFQTESERRFKARECMFVRALLLETARVIHGTWLELPIKQQALQELAQGGWRADLEEILLHEPGINRTEQAEAAWARAERLNKLDELFDKVFPLSMPGTYNWWSK